ncbi:hypothetical protein [[Flexibacter] sp. ATCC 35208]|uniref:hypothetical protein n=1 Tax=[Flexibacter] sp. ATCC 35208 TaxID=1936242 RepID=UPI0009C47D00|nr:hypothetical protein [[Flexibacter] sp. ATCC 35208]OMP79678.1 hypothetical protein BW716_08125 [[Flexibacter] sp. ATCC 35208]
MKSPILLFLLVSISWQGFAQSKQGYFPPRGEWQQKEPSAPASAFVHVGNGSNLIYVDPEHDLVVVMRWIEYKAMDEMIKRVLSAL